MLPLSSLSPVLLSSPCALYVVGPQSHTPTSNVEHSQNLSQSSFPSPPAESGLSSRAERPGSPGPLNFQAEFSITSLSSWDFLDSEAPTGADSGSAVAETVTKAAV